MALQGEIILVFASNTRILAAEELLETKELPFILIPVPKEVNPNCGLAISFAEQNLQEFLQVLDEADLWPESSYWRLGDIFSNYPLPREKT
ncbi:MAG: DUF3343 domain-containing protein [Deltaproteobacteria bacterium]|jgi:hypothetical protein|nr:DUF3343 domain-containing protein [Deltaproteobacteria bacterium]